MDSADSPATELHYEDIAQFRLEAAKWAELFGFSDFIEPEDTWTVWWMDQRPYGVTAKDLFTEYKAMFKKD